MKNNFYKKERGITLIALVITIIVLLILAGVSISMLSGENGILNRAAEAKEETGTAQEKEEEALNSYEEMINGYVDGNTGSGERINWDAILADANANPDSYKHSEQLTSEYIAIGTDGQPVNMDLWNPTKLEDGTFLLGNSTSEYGMNNSYIGSYNGGVIEGMVPQYIYNKDTNTFKPVVKMCSTFSWSALKTAPEIPDTVTDITYLFAMCYELTEVPEIPSGVTNMYGTFYYCTSLTEAPVIPSSVTNLESTFYYCTSLTEAPVIPSSVTNMQGTFSSCTSLTEAPVIPSSVTDMSRTFESCENLTGTITINANPTSYTDCFRNTVQPITLTNSATEEKTATSTTLNNLKGTANNGNVTVEPAK